MVIIVRTNNTIDIKDIDDYSFKNLAKTIDSTKIEPLRVYNSVNSQFDYYFYGVDPDGLNKHKEFSKFATTLSSLQNYYGDVIITKQDSNLNPTGFKNNEELAEIILKLISAFDFLKVGFLEDDLINTKVDDTFLDDVSYVSFGRYPQTLISDKVLSSKLDQITELNNYGYV